MSIEVVHYIYLQQSQTKVKDATIHAGGGILQPQGSNTLGTLPVTRQVTS
jgi:hypothetical protein